MTTANPNPLPLPETYNCTHERYRATVDVKIDTLHVHVGPIVCMQCGKVMIFPGHGERITLQGQM